MYNNEITSNQGLENLTKLKSLFLHNNQLTKIEGLDTLTNLEELRLTSNKITQISGLTKLAQLKTLEMGANQLTGGVQNLAPLANLAILSLGSNKLTAAEIKLLAAMPWLNAGDTAGVSKNAYVCPNADITATAAAFKAAGATFYHDCN